MSASPLRQAAQQLESVLLRQLLRESGVGRVEGTGSHVVTDFFVDALADAVERSGGLGLAPLLEQSLGPAQAAQRAPQNSLAGPTAPDVGGERTSSAHASPALASTHLHAHDEVSGNHVTNNPMDGHQGLLERLVASPRARESSAFGLRPDPITGAQRFHHGVDVAAPAGSPIRSLRAGEVTFAGEAGGYGLMVEIDHGDGLRTRYAHADKVLVQVGQRVAEGAHIADVGSTGRSTGAHLHFEARRNGISADPNGLLHKLAERDETW